MLVPGPLAQPKLSPHQVGGVIADNYGRRVMLAFYTLCCITAAFLFMLDTSLHAMWGNWAVYTGAALLAASWEPKDSALIGSIADLLGSDEANKARVLSALFLGNSVGTFLGFCAAYTTLQMHLPNYHIPWVCFTLAGCGRVNRHGLFLLDAGRL